MTYTELVAAISSTVENTFLTVDINRFIRNAEQRIFSSIDFPVSNKVTTLTLTSGNRYLNCPSDFLATGSLAYPNPTTTGVPKYYAIFGQQAADATELVFILGPTPNAALSAELHYDYYPESITVASSGQTWLGDNLEFVLLYGSLVEAYIFMKGEADMMAVYEAKYKEALMLAKKLGDGAEKMDVYRNGTARVPVA